MELLSVNGTAPESVFQYAIGSLRRIQAHFFASKVTNAKLSLSQKQDAASHIIKWQLHVYFSDPVGIDVFGDRSRFKFEEPHFQHGFLGKESEWVAMVTIHYDRISELEKRIAILESQIKK